MTLEKKKIKEKIYKISAKTDRGQRLNKLIAPMYQDNLKEIKYLTKELIAFEKNEIRNKLFMLLFSYKYQANSLHTYSDLENYQKDSRNIIINSSPFRAQLQIIPEDEKKRLLSIFKKLKINQSLTPDYVVINNSNLSTKFLIYNKKYTKLLSLKSYDIYKKNY